MGLPAQVARQADLGTASPRRSSRIRRSSRPRRSSMACHHPASQRNRRTHHNQGIAAPCTTSTMEQDVKVHARWSYLTATCSWRAAREDATRACCCTTRGMPCRSTWCRASDRTTEPVHHAAGSADRRAAKMISCGARGGSATVGSRDAAAAYLGLELAAEPRLGVPPPATAFPPAAPAEARRGDRRWLIWQLEPASTAAVKALNRWQMTVARCAGPAGSSGRPAGSPARP